MNSTRAPRHTRYGEPAHDPYAARPPRSHDYEYVGTEEPPSYPGTPRHAHGPTNPPSRQPWGMSGGASSPFYPSVRGSYRNQSSYYERVGSPPGYARRASPPPRGRREAPPAAAAARPAPGHKYQNFVQRPGVKRAQTYGMKGLNILGDAAAAYMASQQPQDPRGRSRDPYDSYGPPEPRRSHRKGRRPAYSPSPSPSPSPPPRRRHGRHGDRDRGDRYGRRETFSESPPRSRRDHDRHDRDRGHRDDHRPRRRAHSYSPSPAPRRSRGSVDPGMGGLVAGLMGARSGGGGGKTPDKASAARWQHAARVALEAGGATAMRIRKDPGSWTGDKGAKVATAALGAAAMDAIVGKDSSRRSRDSGGGGSGMKGMATSAITGMLASKIMGSGGKSRKSRY